MKLGIMQPYLFPYIGYFQLIKAVDTFVIYDDVQYINRGWINRNRILQNGQPNLYTFSLQNDSSRKNINERYFTSDFSTQCQEFLKVLQFAYGKAPCFRQTLTLVKRVFDEMETDNMEENIAVKIGRSIQLIADFLHLNTDFVLSSALDKDPNKSGQELILEINQLLDGGTYINPINGKKLYDHRKFKEKNIKLRFLKSHNISYTQFSDEFVPWLSIIDVCMFNDREEIAELLTSYSLVQ